MISLSCFRSFVCAALTFICVGTASAQESDAWAKGNQEYAAGHFREAAELYQGLVQSGQTSAAVFYNLGNARYRNGELGQAILNYERSLTLEPQLPEATANLRIARDKAHALELKRDWIDKWIEHVTASQLSVAAAVAFWIAIFSLAGLLFARRSSLAVGALFVLSLLGLGFAGYGLYSIETGPRGRDLGIVTAKSTDARLAPADGAGVVLTLPPGSEITILSTRGDWAYVGLSNDLRGWIPAQNAERVRL